MIEVNEFNLVNNATGEIFEYHPKRKRIQHLFALYFPQKNRSVLDYFLYFMSSNNVVQIQKTELLTKELNIKQREYFRKVQELIKSNTILRLSNNIYFINPSIYLKASRRAFEKINRFYLIAKSEQQQKQIEKLKVARAGDKLINKVNRLLND